MKETKGDERYWRYGNFAYGTAFLFTPIAAFEIGFRYFDSMFVAISMAFPCLFILHFIGRLGKLSELAEDPSWENPAKGNGYFL